MARKNNVRINSKLNKVEYEPLPKKTLSEIQQRFCQGDAITNQFTYKFRKIYICPHCGYNHDKNYKRINGHYLCLKCKKDYRYPREGQEKYKPSNVMSPGDRTYVENPDWVK